jgi:O-antigen/teichoic acid export membrane protein
MNFLSNFIKVFFLIIFIFLGLGSESISSSYFLGIFVMFLFSFFYCKYKLPELFIKTSLKKKDKKILRKDLLIYSVPLMFYVFIAMVFYWTDSFFIGFFKSPLEVGIYNAAIPISLLLTFVPELFMQLFFPMITKEFSKKNLKLIRELSKQVNKWILLVNLPLFMLLLSFPKLILNILFGSEYLVAQTSLQILLFGQFFFSMSIISQNLILMKGKSKLILFDFCLISFLNIILNYFLIPMEKIWFIDNSFGINGAALSTAFSLICLNVIFSLQTKKYLLIIPLRKKMFNLALSALISFMILLYLKTLVSETIISTILISISFVLFYALFLFLFKALDKNDLMIIQAIKRNFVTYNI